MRAKLRSSAAFPIVALLLIGTPAASAHPMTAGQPDRTMTGPADGTIRDAAPRSSGPFSINLAHPNDFVAQANFVQCVGASVQMMLNIERRGADRTAATQRRLQKIARSLSGPAPAGFVRQGASIRGWSAALTIESGTTYRMVGADSLDEAMRIAATAIRTWNRPVGLLVWRGRHAWVMSGFVATADPATTEDFRVTRAYILDPLYPHGSKTWGPSPRPGTASAVSTVGRQFVRRRTMSMWNALPMMGELAGKYALVVPAGPNRSVFVPSRMGLAPLES